MQRPQAFKQDLSVMVFYKAFWWCRFVYDARMNKEWIKKVWKDEKEILLLNIICLWRSETIKFLTRKLNNIIILSVLSHK